MVKVSSFLSSSVIAVVSCCTEESPYLRTLILGIHHCPSSLSTGEFPLFCSHSSSFSHSLSCSLLSLSPSFSPHVASNMGVDVCHVPRTLLTHLHACGPVSPSCVQQTPMQLIMDMGTRYQCVSAESLQVTGHHGLEVLERECGRFYYATDHADFQSVNQSHPVTTKFT